LDFRIVKRRELIRYLRLLGSRGLMLAENINSCNVTLTLPNPHAEEIGRELLARLLRQAGIDRGDWEKL